MTGREYTARWQPARLLDDGGRDDVEEAVCFSLTISSIHLNGSKTCSASFAVPSQPKYVVSMLAFLTHHEGGIGLIFIVNGIRLQISNGGTTMQIGTHRFLLPVSPLNTHERPNK